MNLHRAAAAAKAALFAAAGAALTVFSQSSREGVSKGISICLNVLVPSLFPMMAVTNLFVKSGVCARLGKPLSRVTRFLFGISGELAPVIVMGLVGGYPVGAGGIAALYQKEAVSQKEASRAALFTVCAGPGFLVSFIGAAVYGNQAVGWMIFAAQMLSVLLLGIFTRIIFPNEKFNNSGRELRAIPLPFSQALVESVYAAARSMLMICAFVLLFSAVTGILEQIIPNRGILNAAYIFLEVCTAVSKLSNDAPPALTAFAIGFGGLCVHFQIFSALGELPVSKWLFFLIRIIQGALTAALTELGLRLLPQQAAVFSTAQAESAAFFGGSVLSGAVIFGVLLCFFISMKQTLKRN